MPIITINYQLFINLFDVKDAAHGEEQEEKGKIAFFCGNPMVEIIKGIIHIYKNKWVECYTISHDKLPPMI